MTVLTVTLNPCIDKTRSAERVVPDRKLRAGEVRLYPGGGGLKVARAIRELGGDARSLWRVEAASGSSSRSCSTPKHSHSRPCGSRSAFART